MNNLITRAIDRVESFFFDPDFSYQMNHKTWYVIMPIFLGLLNAIIIYSYRDIALLSLDYLWLIFIYSVRDYFVIIFLMISYMVPKGTIRDRIKENLMRNDFQNSFANFDYSKHPRYRKKFKFITYLNHFFGAALISAFIATFAVPEAPSCIEYSWYDKSGVEFSEFDLYADFDEKITDESYIEFLNSFIRGECVSWDAELNRFGEQRLYLDFKMSDLYFSIFIWFLPFVLLGTRQGIWSKSNWEVNIENQDKE